MMKEIALRTVASLGFAVLVAVTLWCGFRLLDAAVKWHEQHVLIQKEE